MNDPNRVLTLRNGAEVPEPIVRTAMLTLRQLERAYPIALYEAVQLARDSSHKLFGSTGRVLTELGLLNGGELSWSVRNVILSAAEGDDLGLHIVPPCDPEVAP
jgi:hypothetical protein